MSMEDESLQLNFDQLITKYYKRIAAYSYCCTGNRADADDLCQEVFLKILRERIWERDAKSFKHEAWIFSVTRNTCVDFLKRKKRHREAQAVLESMVLEFWNDRSMSAENHYLQAELATFLSKASDSLTAEERELIRLHLYENHSFTKIEDLLGIPKSTVHRRMSSILHKLQSLSK